MIVRGSTAVYGVIGDPIAHSMSPPMQNRAIEAMGLDAVYVPFRVTAEGLGRAVEGMRALGIRGLNVTIPHKTGVMRFLDRMTGVAEAVGAVNTILCDGGLLVGDNTDVEGFLRCVLDDGGIGAFPETVCVLGAGGAARGVVYGCAQRPEVREIAIINRTPAKAGEIAARFASLTGKRITAHPAEPGVMRALLSGAGMIVNTTPVGMHPDTERSPVPDPDAIHDGQIVCDIITTPALTKFLRDAESRGARTVSGLAMLARQGARSLSLWTGREAPAEVMLDELKRLAAEYDR
jgi:shikimate dehydrogenase